MSKGHQFIVMWDQTGLEYVGDITADQQRVVFETLKGNESRSGINPLHLRLRAQANSQRHYEIYIINAEEGIEAEDITEMFSSHPQTAADTIRQVGHCFYSDRAELSEIKIC